LRSKRENDQDPESEQESSLELEMDAHQILEKFESEYYSNNFDEFNMRFFDKKLQRIAMMGLDARKQFHEYANTQNLHHWTDENGKNISVLYIL
jgi:hypothetical protein